MLPFPMSLPLPSALRMRPRMRILSESAAADEWKDSSPVSIRFRHRDEKPVTATYYFPLFVISLPPYLFASAPLPLPTTHYPRLTLFRYPKSMLDEKDFQRKADAAFEDLKKRLLVLGDEHGFDVEGESGKLEVIFEEPEEAKFVISPNTPVREIWISALSTSFKLGWSEEKNAFVLEKTGEDLYAVMSRVVSQQLGTQVTL